MKSSTNRTSPRPIQNVNNFREKALKYAVWGGRVHGASVQLCVRVARVCVMCECVCVRVQPKLKRSYFRNERLQNYKMNKANDHTSSRHVYQQHHRSVLLLREGLTAYVHYVYPLQICLDCPLSLVCCSSISAYTYILYR